MKTQNGVMVRTAAAPGPKAWLRCECGCVKWKVERAKGTLRLECVNCAVFYVVIYGERF